MPHSLQYNLCTGTQDSSAPFGFIPLVIATFPLFYSSAASLSCLWYFWYFLPVIHLITPPPFLRAVFYHACYHFLESGGRWGGVKQKQTKRQSTASTQQISITSYAWSKQSSRVINWHVAAGQQCIALVRYPQCNKMQWKESEWKKREKGKALSVDWDLKKGSCRTIYLGSSSDQLRRWYQHAGLRRTKLNDIHFDK